MSMLVNRAISQAQGALMVAQMVAMVEAVWVTVKMGRLVPAVVGPAIFDKVAQHSQTGLL